jgi:transposase-like protein
MDEQQQRQSKQPRARRAFTKEYKRDAVELVRATGRPIAQIARDLGMGAAPLQGLDELRSWRG